MLFRSGAMRRIGLAGLLGIALAIGGGEFVHAPNSSGVVRIERLTSSYWASRFLSARRIS